MQLSDLLRSDIVKIDTQSSALALVDALRLHGSASAVVMRERSIIGVVTTIDLIPAFLAGDIFASLPVSKLPMHSPLLLQWETDVKTAYTMLTKWEARHIIVIDENDTPCGILDEKALLSHLPPEFLLQSRRLEQLIDPYIPTVEFSAPLKEAFSLMQQHPGDAVIVTKEGTPCGIITDFDLLHGLELDTHCRSEAVMSAPLVTIRTHQTVLEASETMHRKGIRHLLVIDAEGLPSGIVTESRLLKTHLPRELFPGHRTPYLFKLHQSGVDEGLLVEHILKHAPGIIFVIDAKAGRVLYINPGIETLTGISPQSITGRGTEAIDTFIHPEDRPKLRDAMQQLASGEANAGLLLRMDDAEGHLHTLNCFLGHYPGNDGAERIVGIASDISAQLANEERLRILGNLFEKAEEGVLIADEHNRIIDVNPAFERLTGYTKNEMIGEYPSMLQSGRHDSVFYTALWRALKETGHWYGEIWNRRKDGTVYPEMLSINVLKSAQGNITHYIGMFSDITLQKASEAKLNHVALHDALTDTPNRFLLDERIAQNIRRSHRSGEHFILLFLDLNDFKLINDSYGHTAGDAVLVEVSRRLQTLLRAQDTLARFGGDEFVVLVENIHGTEEADTVAEKLLEVFDTPFIIQKNQYYIGASVGIAMYPRDGTDSTALIRAADAAMYQAKQKGPNRFAYYSQEIGEASRLRIRLESSLRNALENGEFELYYQPQVQLPGGEFDGAEALLRWHHPELGLLGPDHFIAVAERTRQIIPISRWILETVCSHAASWVEQGRLKGRVAVNISGLHLEEGDLVSDVKNALASTGLPVKHLALEITESVLMQNSDRWKTIMVTLRDMGVSLAIDDFGTGYSSLSQLNDLPLSVLKIDKSFIQLLPYDRDAGAIAKSVITLANSLGLSTLAEGVETKAQQQWLTQMGCDFAQGFHISRPMTYHAFNNFIDDLQSR